MIIVLTPHDSPPMVEIAVSEMSPQPSSIEIIRIIDAEEWPVRIAGQVIAGSGAHVEDHEAPTGILLRYRITTYDANGAILESGQEETGPLADADGSMVWLSDPLDNTSSRLALMTSETDNERTFPIPLDIAFPRSSVYGSAAYSHAAFGRRQLGPTSWAVYVGTGEEYSALLNVLGGPVLIRPQAWRRIAPSVYGVADGMSAEVVGSRPTEWQEHGTHLNYFGVIKFVITPTRGPAANVLIPRRTWRNVDAENGSWREVSERYPSWRAVLRGDS